MGSTADVTARQIRSINRQLNDPGLNTNQRAVAESKKGDLLRKLQQQRNQEINQARQRVQKPSANGRPSPGNPYGGGKNAVNAKAKPSFNPGGSVGTASNPLNTAFAAISIPANAREGWDRGTSGPLGNPALGAINAAQEVLGAFVPAYAYAEAAVDIVSGAFKSSPAEKVSIDPPTDGPVTVEGNTTTTQLPVSGGQDEGVSYRVTTESTVNGGSKDEREWILVGPIGFFSETVDNQNSTGKNFQLTHQNGTQFLRATTNVDIFDVNASIVDIERVDGQPDNSGDRSLPVASPGSRRRVGAPVFQNQADPQPQVDVLPDLQVPAIPDLPLSPEAPSTPENDSEDNKKPSIPNFPSVVPPLVRPPGNSSNASNQNRPESQNGRKSNPSAPNAGAGCGCNSGVNAHTDNVVGQLNKNLGEKLDAIQQGAQTAQLAAILAKLAEMQAFAEKAWKNTHIDKLINLLTLVTVLHNAAMISRDIGETLGYVVSNGLAAVGVTDEEGNALNINELVGGSVENFIRSVVGADVYDDVRTSWQKANRVIQAGSNIIWTIRNINDATQDVLEWTAENTGKIGNALKKYGVVGDRAYPWMSERIKAQDFYRRKFGRIFQGLETAEETASSLAVVTSNVREIQEEVSELGEARNRFVDAVSDFGPDDIPGLPVENQLPSSSPENQPIAGAAANEESVSQSPDVTIPTDGQKGDSPDDTP